MLVMLRPAPIVFNSTWFNDVPGELNAVNSVVVYDACSVSLAGPDDRARFNATRDS
jgi:hypothetical protein